MTPATWQTVGVIAGLAVSVITVYLAAKSSIREQARQREAAQERAVADAKAPLIAENVQLSSQVAALKIEATRRDEIYGAELARRDQVHRAEMARKDDRITELEDRLYGRKGQQ